jgi:BirA family biotin operon repressor/biotin-[acetyl-CoA-carboxylase] ligase
VPALAVAAVVRELIKPPVVAAVSLKWPNDVYVGDQKIAGILVQNGLRGKAIAWSVIGIGLNVNEVNFPSELTTVATSLRLLTGRQLDRQAVRGSPLRAVATPVLPHDSGRMGQLQRDYHRQLYRLNQPGRYQRTNDNSTFFAILRGVAPMAAWSGACFW